jgi:uncharacterized protein involved in cysteine biosynthesis
MLDAVFKALSDMVSPPLRAVFWKSVGLAILLIVIAAVGVQRALVWLTDVGQIWAENTLGPSADTPLTILSWVLSIAAGLGVVAGSILLMPAVTALVASFFVDDIAEQVERNRYPGEPVGAALALPRAMLEGIKTALWAVLIYLVALPFLLVAGLGLVVFFLATAYLLGREYFELAAMRYHTPAEAKRLRRAHSGTVFGAGLFIAGFVSIPILNLATPLFGTALMVHMHKRLAGQRPLVG